MKEIRREVRKACGQGRTTRNFSFCVQDAQPQQAATRDFSLEGRVHESTMIQSLAGLAYPGRDVACLWE